MILLKRLVLAVVLLMVLALGGGLLALMSVPQGYAVAPPGPAPRPSESLKEVKALMSRATLFSAFQGTPLEVSLPRQDIDAVLQDLAGRWAQGGAKTEGHGQKLTLLASIPTSQTPVRWLTPLGRWINLQVSLTLPAEGPPSLESIRLGRMQLPPRLVVWAAERALDSYELLRPAQLLVASVKRVSLTDEDLTLSVHWTNELQGQTLALVVPPDDWPRLHVYHEQILSAVQRVPLQGRMNPGHPLREVLHGVFMLAHQRTMAHALLPEAERNLPTDEAAARENRAALVAVALAANNLSLHYVLPQQGSRLTPRLPGVSLRLRGREDFAQHYTISALMALMVGGRAADTVGLYKELMDASKSDGGSGFSFNDLALNRAGIRLGQRARQSPVALQERLGGDRALLSDDDFIPKVNDLPEFLSREELLGRYGGMKDRRFENQMRDIDARISALPVLQ